MKINWPKLITWGFLALSIIAFWSWCWYLMR